MKRAFPILFFAAVVAAQAAEHLPTITLSEALASQGRAGVAVLSEGYRGELRVIARTGIASQLPERDPVETIEFSHVHFDHRGVGGHHKPVLALVVGGRRGYRRPAVHLGHIPSIKSMRTFKHIADFERVFGKFREVTDGWGLGDGTMHSSCYWTGFTLQPNGSLRVVSVFLHTSHRGKSSNIDGAVLREGFFKPTGKSPQPKKR